MDMQDINICPICISKPLEDTTTVNNISWLQCDVCNQWFHTPCLKLPSVEVNNLYSYHCNSCAATHGPSMYRRKSKRAKVKIDYVALNDGDVFAVDKSVHPHIDNFFQFDVNSNEAGTKSNPYIDITDDLSKVYVLSSRLTKPILLPHADHEKVGMRLPKPGKDITIDYITEAVGEDTPIEVMDVLSQQGVNPGWNMGKWRDYFHTDELSRDRIRNVISLEISQVDKLGKDFSRPIMVKEMDLVDKVWFDSKSERPKVTKYCLMSVKGSFTDFHIDFSGTSVYYTVCSGSKTFLMFPPTQENLSLYTSWCLEPNQNFIWFADYSKTEKGRPIKPENGFKVTLKAGDLFIIPSGWVHAVYTPEDSIVIGGNFLTLMDMSTQLKVNYIEKVTKVPTKFRFPSFNKVLWLTSWYYYNHKEEYLSDLRGRESNIKKEQDKTNSIQYITLKALIEHLKSHFELSKSNQMAKKSIPIDIIGKDIVGYLIQLDNWLRNLCV